MPTDANDAPRRIKTVTSPRFAKVIRAREDLVAAIDREFGLLTTAEATLRMGSEASRGYSASTARAGGRLLAIIRGRTKLFPGFQFDETGIRPVIASYAQLGRQHGHTEPAMIRWLAAPTAYLDNRRPVDIIDNPDHLLSVARQAFGIQW